MLVRVRMARCTVEEPAPPTDPDEFEEWCESGNSGRPIQTHVGDAGIVLWARPDQVICVEFDDGDQRLLKLEEVELVDIVDVSDSQPGPWSGPDFLAGRQ